VASSAGARPVGCSVPSQNRCSLVRTPTFESSWGRCFQTPTLPRAMPAAPSAGARPGALCSRTHGWLRLYSTPTFRCALPLFAALGLFFRQLATAGNETLAILRGYLHTSKVIRCGGLKRKTVCCTYRRRRAGESFYRSRGGEPRIPSPMRSATNATMTVASNISRRCTKRLAVGKLASDL
jgi:hypothetical protein